MLCCRSSSAQSYVMMTSYEQRMSSLQTSFFTLPCNHHNHHHSFWHSLFSYTFSQTGFPIHPLVRQAPRASDGVSTEPYNSIQFHTMPYNSMQCHTMPCNAIQFHTVPYNAMQCAVNSVQYNALCIGCIECNYMQFSCSHLSDKLSKIQCNST